jgi:hypothetical protein
MRDDELPTSLLQASKPKTPTRNRFMRVCSASDVPSLFAADSRARSAPPKTF